MMNFESENGTKLENQIENNNNKNNNLPDEISKFDYSFVHSITRIALYDDLLSAPRITEIQPAKTGEYIAELARQIYEQAKSNGGTIPYTVIREVSENFIHAQFTETTVSIFDQGNTIRFTDQGPGITQKAQVQEPGFTSAIEPMKSYIRGVGSGLPIVREYLDVSHGTISIEDNLNSGSVVTISLKRDNTTSANNPVISENLIDSNEKNPDLQNGTMYHPQRQNNTNEIYTTPQIAPSMPQGVSVYQGVHNQNSYNQGFMPQPLLNQSYNQFNGYQENIGYGINPYTSQPNPYQQGTIANPQQYMSDGNGVIKIALGLNDREKEFLKLLLSQEVLGVTEITNLTGIANSSVHATLRSLETSRLIEKTNSKKRVLTPLGKQVAFSL